MTQGNLISNESFIGVQIYQAPLAARNAYVVKAHFKQIQK